MSKTYNYIMAHKETIKKFLPVQLLKHCKAELIRRKIHHYQAKSINLDVFKDMPVGINLIGDIRAEIGLGQSMRLIAHSLSLSKYAFGIVNALLNVDVRRHDHSWDHKIQQHAPYTINLLHINPLELGDAYLRLGDPIWKNHYNIGFWLWELEDFPSENAHTLKFVDEIWTPSEFTSNCFRKLTDKPVYTIPYNVTAETNPRFNRCHFGLPEDKFLYLVMFDFNSTMLRKNPIGAIEAFKLAFPPEAEDIGLVIKVNNSTEECLHTLSNLLQGYKNIYYVANTLDKTEVNSLIGCVDVFVSLHRAEGFGLVMAEAMLLRTVCIATNWSSNTEFMDSNTACMVSCTMKQIAEGEGSYPPGAVWADPSVEEAAVYMKKLKENPDYYQKLSSSGYEYVSEILGEKKVIEMLEYRIDQIHDSVLSCDMTELAPY